MIDIEQLKSELAGLLYKKTAVFTAVDRMPSRNDRGYIVTMGENESRIIAGGTQLERSISVSVICLYGKYGGVTGGMKKRLYDALFPYFTVCNRRFVPLDARFEREENFSKLVFEISFCDVLDREEYEYSLMSNIKFDIFSGGLNGITADSYQL